MVDNLALAEIANGTVRITNDNYMAPLSRIRTRLKDDFQRSFEYKAGFLEPVDWRSREYNKAADHVCNCVLAGAKDIDTLDTNAAARLIRTAVGLQIYTDGGFIGHVGAAAFVVYGIFDGDGAFQIELIGARGVFIDGSRSAFHAEVSALDLATEWLVELLGRIQG